MGHWLRFPVIVAQLWRLHACITAGIGVLVSAYLTGLEPGTNLVVFMVATVFIITGAGNTLNDYFDWDIDEINRQGRAIPAGRVSRKAALNLATVSFFVGVAVSLFTTWWCITIAIFNTFLLIWYARFSKQVGLLKNIVVAYLVGSLFLLGASEFDLLSLPLLVLAFCASMATFAREIVKDIEDMKGDSAYGAKTLPVVHGLPFSYKLVYVALTSAALMAFLPYITGHMGQVYLYITLLGDGVFLAACMAKRAALSQRIIMIASIIQLSAFIFGHSA